MLRFRDRMTVPPGQKYFYTVPETGARFESASPSHLLTFLREHYYENSLELPPRLMDLVEHHMCLELPETFCVGRIEDATEQRANVFTFQDIRAVSMGYDINLSPSPVDLAARAAACAQCPRNIRGMCGTCTGLRYTAAGLLRGRDAPNSAALNVCAIDGGFLPIKVYASMQSIRRVTNGVVHSGCWAHEEVRATI
jgi:hypothetical protein